MKSLIESAKLFTPFRLNRLTLLNVGQKKGHTGLVAAICWNTEDLLRCIFNGLLAGHGIRRG